MNNGITSAGVVATDELANALNRNEIAVRKKLTGQ
jgi:hypothetical protein